MEVNINQAHKELMNELFGSAHKGTGKPRRLEPVTRSRYTEAMKKVQDKYGLKQGHPQFLEWVFTCVGHSPIIVEDEEGDDKNE